VFCIPNLIAVQFQGDFKMNRVSILSMLCASMFLVSGHANAAEPESCKTVRVAEPGWNDLAFTTGTSMVVLRALGYDAQSSILGIEVIYQSMKNKDLDAFLGYWDPSMVNYFKAYKDEGSVETIVKNLEGAKYTFAVPAYVWDAGVKDFKDMQKFADKFGKKVYGIDAGSNQPMVDAVADPSLGLGGWEVVESSEVGMLTEVERAVRKNEFVAFLGWAPHPMNTLFDIKYLTGGDKQFGPDFGAATVSTQVRKGYVAECPNVGRLLQNLAFDIDYENKGMKYLITDGKTAEEAATLMIKAEPQRLDKWLAGVTTLDGKDGLTAVKTALGL
jgi:glycine betaine/proline transport system substrate-binding protein